ncbi:hypothetical protein [Moorena producens]|nr:hypothetical protein [Moorena producens]
MVHTLSCGAHELRWQQAEAAMCRQEELPLSYWEIRSDLTIDRSNFPEMKATSVI